MYSQGTLHLANVLLSFHHKKFIWKTFSDDKLIHKNLHGNILAGPVTAVIPITPSMNYQLNVFKDTAQTHALKETVMRGILWVGVAC